MKVIYNKLAKIFKSISSKSIVWISLVIITSINISYENWNQEFKIIAWDVNSYYAYLPTVFIYKDLEMDFIKQGDEKITSHYWPITTDEGRKVILTPMGMAYLYAPFFLGGHAVAQFTEFAGDEFSPPYKIALIVSCLFYFTIGLFFLRKVLLNYYSDKVTAITLIAIIFGTNLLHYVTDEPTMTHAYSFALFSAFLWSLIKFFQKPGFKFALLSGALAGLITLVRPSNFIIVLLFVFWDVGSFRDLGNRILFYLKNIHLLLLMILAFTLIWVPQFMYYYHQTGWILFNPYDEKGSNFFFDNPQICNTLFSFRKGWFIYTPMIIFAISGIYLLYKEKAKTFVPVFIYLIVNTYVVSSWWCWWYGGGFGLRSFIESYAILAIPLAALIAWALKQKIFIKAPIFLLMALIAFVALFQTAQYRQGSIHFVSMSKTSYWASFLDLTPPSQYWDNLVYPNYPDARKGIYYPETEIPYSMEKQIDMRGWEYVDVLKDSVLNDASRMEILQNVAKSGHSLDSLVYQEALIDFRKAVEKHKKEKQ